MQGIKPERSPDLNLPLRYMVAALVAFISFASFLAALLREAEYHADHVRQGLPDHIPYPPAEGGHREQA